jgi:general secretion pathway protein F
MGSYRYKGVDTQGEVVEGRMEAGAEAEVVKRLQEAGLLPIQVQAASGAGSVASLLPSLWRGGMQGLRRRDVAAFTQELATLLGAGLALDRALQMLLELTDDTRLRRVIARIDERVRAGATLSAALEEHGGPFSGLYVSMVRAGEASGALDQALARLAEHLERMRELRNSVLSALIYPLILLVVAGVSVLVLLIVVVPRFTALFEDMGAALPLSTQLVFSTAELLRGYGWILAVGVLGMIAYVRVQRAVPSVRRRWDRRLLRVPVLGDVLIKVEVARFSRTLGTLLGSGVPLLGALGIVRDTLTNRAVAEAVEHASGELQQGRGLAGPLAGTEVFPRMAVQMIRVGEESGRLDEMLLRVAGVYDREVRLAIQRLLALLEPVLIVGLGLLIAAIVLALLSAVLSMNELVL